jgi:uncharacterized membrane protein YozB (DUF420 family)
MQILRALLVILGILQSVIGTSIGVLAVLVALDIIGVNELVNLPIELLPFYLLVLSLFSVFSIVNGVFLIREWRKQERRVN